MKTKWLEQSENRDGSGYKYYQCQCPQPGDNGYKLEHLYVLCYAPKTNKLWFWDEMNNESEAVRMVCPSWVNAEAIKAMLTIGKSHWMVAHQSNK